MGTITYTNFLAENPALDEILDATGVAGTRDATTYEVINNNGGATDGFVFRLTGTGFTYSGGTANGGTVTGFEVRDGLGNLVVSGTGLNRPLIQIVSGLQDSSDEGLRQLFGNASHVFSGSNTAIDHLTYYQSDYNFSEFNGGGGNDQFRAIPDTFASVRFVGGEGDDLFRFENGGGHIFGSAFSGGAGGGGEDEYDILEIATNFINIATARDIDEVRFATGLAIGTSASMTLEVLSGQLPGTLVVRGSADNHSEELSFFAGSFTSYSLDLSGWTFENWDRSNQRIFITTRSEVLSDTIIGSVSRDTISTFGGVDSVHGNAGDDIINGGAGPDTLYGDAGNDTLTSYSGEGPTGAQEELLDGGADSDLAIIDRSSLSIDLSIDISDPGTISAIGDGTKVVNVERLNFTGGSGKDTIRGGALADTLNGNNGDDKFILGAGEAVSGEIINGGGNTDTIELLGDNDLTGVSFSSIENVAFAAAATLSFGSSNYGGTLAFTGNADANAVVVKATGTTSSFLYLQNWTFTSWGVEDSLSVTASAGNDTIYLPNMAMIVDGLAGFDDIRGGSQDDELSGGSDGDYLEGNGGADTLDGGSGNDNLIGGADGDTLRGGGDADSLQGDAGADILEGDTGTDNLYGGGDDDTLRGGGDNDNLYGEAGADILEGDAGNDNLLGGDEGDTLRGGGDNDNLYGEAGADILEGDAGTDNLYGGADGDTLRGGGDNDYLEGNDGADILQGGLGQDSLNSGAGDDFFDYDANEAVSGESINGGANSDAIRIFGDNDFSGVSFSQVERLQFASASSATFNQSLPSTFTLAGDANANAVIVKVTGVSGGTLNLQNWTFTSWGAEDSFSVIGSAGNDTIYLPNMAMIVDGLAGNDGLYGGSAVDKLSGGADNDTLGGNGGADILEGDAGTDNLYGGGDDDTLRGGGDNDNLHGEAGVDILEGDAGADNLYGGADGDTLRGGGDNDGLNGDAGADILEGGAGADDLHGGDGDDFFDYVAGEAVSGESINGGADSDAIRIFGDNDFSGVSFSEVESLQFASASSVTFNQSLPSTFTLAGDANANAVIVKVTGVSGGTLNLQNWTFTSWGAEDSFSVIGSAGNDAIYLPNNAMIVDGLAGSDDIRGGSQDDELSGGSDGDYLEGNGGADILDGGTGGDNLNGGGDGDTLRGGSDGDSLSGEAGADILEGDAGTDILYGGTEGDALRGGGDNDGLNGDAGADILEGGAGADDLHGGDGDDFFDYGAGEAASGENLDGGADTDTIRVSGDNDFSGVTFSQVERLEFKGAVTVTFNHTVSPTLVIAGDANANTVMFTLTSGAAALDDIVFENWSAEDTIGIQGDGNANTLGLTSIPTLVDGKGGIDTLAINRPSSTLSWTIDLANPAVEQTLADGSSIVDIERLDLRLGTGADVISGGGQDDYALAGGGADTLNGRGGGDTLFGEGGDDILDGGSGYDNLQGGDGDDQMFSRLGEGADYLQGGDGVDFAFVDRSTTKSSLNLDIDDSTVVNSLADGTYVQEIERIEFRAGSGNDTLTGGSLADILLGGAGRDLLDGNGGEDTLTGGAGIDTLDGDDGDDLLDGGADADTLDGGAGKDSVLGGAGSDNLAGGAGDDTLDGGTGIDIMDGGEGDDIFVVDHLRDAVNEDADSGVDLVRSAVDFTLEDNLENLTLTGAALKGTGNGLANTIIGTTAANLLDGGAGNDKLDGGLGADDLRGGAGDDTYTTDNAADIVTDAAGQGAADRVIARVSYALGAAAEIEVLTTNGSSGTSAISLTGNLFHQEIIGNAGANTLNSGAGSGGAADLLRGLSGNDTYRVYNSGDLIQESVAQGTADKVGAAVDYALGAGVHVEVVTTNGSTGTAAIDLTGNELVQSIFGNAGSNILDGKDGNDTLSGLGGKDLFAFTTALGVSNIDSIADFSVVDDTIQLENAIFTALAVTGPLASGYFRANATGTAQDSNDHVIYETDAGKLFYDADGTGATAGIHFATVTVGLALTNADFSVA